MKRRQFLKGLSLAAAGLAGFPAIVPARALGRSGSIAPSNRIVMAGIGYGAMGTANMKVFLGKDEVQWVAVCDVDKNHLRAARNMVNRHYGHQDCTTYHDYRELCLRQDIDAVSIAVPDHWHALISIACARAGFDIYGEKPLTHSLWEGRALCDTVERYGRVWQSGSWQRSKANFHRAAELVRNDRIGKICMVEVGMRSGFDDYADTEGQETAEPPPEHLDYDFWLGPAPYAPYCPARVHKNWRWNMDYGGGQLMDWVGHHVDIAHWGLGFDLTGPTEIRGWGEFTRSGVWNSPTRYYLEVKYADNTPMVVAGGHDKIKEGIKWIGDRGWVWCDRDRLEADPPELLQEFIGPDELRLYKSRDHYQNFLDCVKRRKLTISPCEVGHRSASVGHLGLIAMELGRKLRFDPEKETIVDDPEANRHLGRSYRSPWQLAG
jgi:predicted dehydrogenase